MRTIPPPNAFADSYNKSKEIPSAEALIELRKTMNQSEIAKYFNVTQSRVSIWFNCYKRQGIDIKQAAIMPSAEILAQMCKTMSHKEIAKYFGVYPYVISRWVQYYSAQGVDVTKNTTIPDVTTLIELFKTLDKEEVAEHFNVSVYMISQWLLHYASKGIDINLLTKPSNKLVPEQERILELYETMSTKEIAAELNIPCASLYVYIRKLTKQGLITETNKKRRAANRTKARTLRKNKMGNGIITPETMTELLKTNTLSQIATMYGVSRQCVHQIITKYEERGLMERYERYRNRPKMPSDEELTELCKTMTRPQIAEHFGVNIDTVRHWERYYAEQGVTINPAKPVKPQKPIPGQETIIELYGKVTLGKIAEELGVSYQTIFRRVNELAARNLLTKDKKRIGHSGKRNKPMPSAEELSSVYNTHTVQETANYFNVAVTTIYAWKNRYEKQGLIDAKLRRIERPSAETLIELYAAMTQEELAKHFHVGHCTVYQWFKYYGITKSLCLEKKNINSSSFKKRPSAETLTELSKAMTPIELAKHFDVAINTVYSWFKYYNTEKKQRRLQRRHLTPPSAETLVELHKTMTKTEIARHFNVGRATVNRWFDYYTEPSMTFEKDVAAERPKGMPSAEELAELYKTMDQKQIARHYGVKPTTVASWFCRHHQRGTTIKNPKRNTTNYLKRPPAKTLIKLSKTMSRKQIAEHFGAHPTTVNRWFRHYAEHGIDLKTTS